MNGIDKITGQIAADAEAEAARILAQAKARAAEAAIQAEREAQAEADAIVDEGRKAAARRLERLESMAALECRKHTLAAKQELVDAAFDRALEQLTAMPEEEYASLLAALAVSAARTGREEIILSPADRDRVGDAVAAKANALLAKSVAPKLPDQVTETRAGAILDKVATAVTAIAKGTAMLTVADETRPMAGGLILRDGPVETNCSFEVLLRLQRDALAAEVAKVLFE